MTEIDTDVAIVGYGPVGQTTAALLAGDGHRVAVYERFPELYDRPRAVYFDDEIMRVWQSLGIAEEIDALPARTYEWFGADGEPIIRLEHPPLGPSGWASGYVFFQPTLERALDRRVRALPAASLHRGWTAESLVQAPDHVELTLRRGAETQTVRARYVVGADGANSVVRQAAGIAFEDLGFAERWLVVDVRPDDMEALSSLPAHCQWCDPERPRMHTRNGRSHHRFEFMLLPGERPEDFADEARVWELLAPWFEPVDGSLVRHAVYEFRGRLAQTMRAGRVLLAGDAAHTMPPFMGQGLCSGVRDAANLAWRLDLILHGLADDRLLDGYTAERRPQNEWIVALSTEMGRVSCELDPAAAAERDAVLRGAAAPPPLALPPLQDGTLAARPLAGHRAVSSREGLTATFVLLTRRPADLSAACVHLLEQIGGCAVALGEQDGRLTDWFDVHGVEAVLVRPDAYVFGAVEALDDIPALVADLRSHLFTTETKVTADVH